MCSSNLTISLAMTSAQLRAIPAPNIGCGTDILACSAQEGPVGRIHGHTAISGMVAREIRRGLGSSGATSGGDLKPQAARPPNPFCAHFHYFYLFFIGTHKLYASVTMRAVCGKSSSSSWCNTECEILVDRCIGKGLDNEGIFYLIPS
jgi:hypothetical protein